MGQLTRDFVERMLDITDPNQPDHGQHALLTIWEEHQLAHAWMEREQLRQQIAALESQLSASQAELAAVREDAARYRCLREHMTYRDIGYTSDPSGRTGMLCTPLQRRWYHDSRLLTCDTLDAAIDAERAERAARKETE